MCSPCFASASRATATAACPDATARGGDAALELRDASLEHEHGRVRGAAVDVALAAQREQVARLAQRGELEGIGLVDRRHRGVLGDTGGVPRLHLRRRERARSVGHSAPLSMPERSPADRVSNCCGAPCRRRAFRGHDVAMALLISPTELAELQAAGAPVRLLDVRWRLDRPEGRPDYLAGHLPGAVYVDLDRELVATRRPVGGPASRCPRAKRSQDAAQRLGHLVGRRRRGLRRRAARSPRPRVVAARSQRCRRRAGARRRPARVAR